MKIYADTSFLVSLLYAKDKGHPAAAGAFVSHGTGAEWITSAWSRFETFNSLRQLRIQQPNLSPLVSEALCRYFRHLHGVGQFSYVETSLDEAVLECHQISAAHGSIIPMRSADVLHVALLEQLTPDLFITRDAGQHKLAVARAFQSELVP